MTQRLRFRPRCTRRTANKRLQVERLETRDLLTAASFTLTPLVQVSDASPLLFDQSDIPGQAGRVFLNSEVEPQIAVNPTNPLHVVGAWQQDRWSGSGARGLVAGISNDGGVTWDVVPIPKFSPVLEGQDLRYTDPWVTFGPEGNLYVAALAVTLAGPFPAHSAIVVAKSTDDGHNWTEPITLDETVALPGSNPIDLLHDKESITADPTRPGYVYAIWSRLNHPSENANFNAFHGFAFRGDTLFARSTDGGETWEETQVLLAPNANGGGIGHQIVVMPETSAHPGRLVDVFGSFQGSDNQPVKSARDKVKVIYSDDAGVTWSEPSVIADMLDHAVTNPDTGGPIRVGEPIPDVAVDPNNGNLYAVWDDSRFSDKYEYDGIAFSMSTDGGLNWSEPIKVNQTPTNIPPANQQAFVPSVAVADNGTVAITYYDFRNNTPDADLPADYWLVHASGDFTNPASWQSDEKRMTDASFNMANAPVSRGFFLGDYQGLAAAGNSFYALFAQAGANSNDPSSIWFRDPPPAPAGQETPTPTGALTTALAAARRDAVFYGTRLRSSAALGRAVSHTGAWKPALGVSPQRTPAARSELRVVTTDRALELITGERHEILSRSSSAATPLGSEADWFLRISPRLR